MANPIRPSHKIKPGGKPQSGQGGQGGRTIGVRPLTQTDSNRTARHNAGQTAERILPSKPTQNNTSTLRPNPVVKPAHTVSRQTSAPVRPGQASPQAQAAKQLEQLMRSMERPAAQQSANTAAQTTAHTASRPSTPSLGKAVRTGVALGAGSALLGALLSGAMRSGQSLQELQKMPELQGMSQEELRRALEEFQQENASPAKASDPFASTVECSHCSAPIPAGVRVCEYCGCSRTGEEEEL